MLRAVREIQPLYVVGENVRGLTNWNGGLVFDEVQADMEAEGYEVLPFLLPACGVNAPHRRDRIWFVAHYQGQRCGEEGEYISRPEKRPTRHGDERNAANAYKSSTEYKIQTGRDVPAIKDEFATADSYNINGRERAAAENGEEINNCDKQFTPDTDGGVGCEGGMYEAGQQKAERHPGTFDSWYGRGDWKDFPTQSPIRCRNDGLSGQLDATAVFNKPCKPKGERAYGKWRNESIKGYGNAIVPQVAYEIFKVIQAMEDNTPKVA